MSTERCPRCGAEGTAGAPCPQCLMEPGPQGDESASTMTARPVSPPTRPDRIGPYRILDTLGEGGMGVVYLAEQDEPVRRRVALKVMKHGMDTQQVVARFETERQALAVMNHPAIAKVFDAGVTPDGRPYFVMEHVQGVPITEHCDRNRLTNRERLDLFREVCDGVQHAHHKAIIHRDLKPSNVLVSLVDGRPLPKIIDFGVAKAVARKLTDKTLHTELGVLIGTPAYMSPEQAEMTGQDIDTRTDVYSLGVMLYELLVGALPFDPRELKEAGVEAMVRRIREAEPPKPSTRLSTLGERSTESASLRRTEPAALRRELKGDLDWITMKALERDRARRYASPGEFAADIQHHLKHEPVIAGPPSAVYRMGKFVRRHRLAVALGVAAVVLLAGIAVRERTQATRIAVERDRARKEAETATRVSDFLAGLFEISDPGISERGEVTARELLDKGAEQIDETLADEPEVRARLKDLMGMVYQNLGYSQEGQSLLEAALATRRSVLGDDDPATLLTMRKLGQAYAWTERHDEAEALLREAVETAERTAGSVDSERLLSKGYLADLYMRQGRYDEAEPLHLETLEEQEQVFGEDHRFTLDSMSRLATLYRKQARFSEAEPLEIRALAGRRRTLGGDHRSTIDSVVSLGQLYFAQKRYDEAEPLYVEALEVQRRIFGDDHANTLFCMGILANLHNKRGQYDEAEELYVEVLERQKRLSGSEHSNTLMTMSNLALLLWNRGRLDEAEALYLEALASYRRVRGKDHPDVGVVAVNLGGVYRDAGDFDASQRYFERSYEIFEAKLPPGHPYLAHTLTQWAKLLRETGDDAGAERMEARAAEMRDK